jgi:hypothetical protein
LGRCPYDPANPEVFSLENFQPFVYGSMPLYTHMVLKSLLTASLAKLTLITVLVGQHEDVVNKNHLKTLKRHKGLLFAFTVVQIFWSKSFLDYLGLQGCTLSIDWARGEKTAKATARKCNLPFCLVWL